MITFCCLAEQVTLIRQTEAPDSNVTEAQAKEFLEDGATEEEKAPINDTMEDADDLLEMME